MTTNGIYIVDSLSCLCFERVDNIEFIATLIDIHFTLYYHQTILSTTIITIDFIGYNVFNPKAAVGICPELKRTYLNNTGTNNNSTQTSH